MLQDMVVDDEERIWVSVDTDAETGLETLLKCQMFFNSER